MTSVGIRELKAHLAEYIRRAEKGESITVTDRGRAVARLGPEPATKPTIEERVRQLVAEGFLEWDGGKPDFGGEPIEPATPGFSLSDLVVTLRDEDLDALVDNIFGRPAPSGE